MSRADSIITIYLPTGGEAPIVRRRFLGSDGPRVAIVAGIRGDTPEGMRIAYYLAPGLGCLVQVACCLLKYQHHATSEAPCWVARNKPEHCGAVQNHGCRA